MIGHEAEREELDGVSPQHLGQDAAEGMVVGRLVKQRQATVAAVHQVVGTTPHDGTRYARHGR